MHQICLLLLIPDRILGEPIVCLLQRAREHHRTHDLRLQAVPGWESGGAGACCHGRGLQRCPLLSLAVPGANRWPKPTDEGLTGNTYLLRVVYNQWSEIHELQTFYGFICGSYGFLLFLLFINCNVYCRTTFLTVCLQLVEKIIVSVVECLPLTQRFVKFVSNMPNPNQYTHLYAGLTYFFYQSYWPAPYRVNT